MQSQQCALVLDFGGTKLTAGIVELSTGNILVRQRIATNSKSAQTNLDFMIQAGKQLLEQVDPQAVLGIGISFGGPIEPDRRHIARSMHVQVEMVSPCQRLSQTHSNFPPSWTMTPIWRHWVNTVLGRGKAQTIWFIFRLVLESGPDSF